MMVEIISWRGLGVALVLGLSLAIAPAAVADEFDDLIYDAQSDDYDTWYNAISALDERLDDPRVVDALVWIIEHDDDSHKRSVAVDQLMMLDVSRIPSVIDVIIEVLESDPYNSSRLSAAIILHGYYASGRYADSPPLNALHAVLQDADEAVRASALNALGSAATAGLGVSETTIAAAGLSPRDEFNSLITQIRDGGGYLDLVLAEQVIALAGTVQPLPALPEEAIQHMARGKAAFKMAQGTNDLGAVLQEFQLAAIWAPWWPDPYFNIGLVYEKQRDYYNATNYLNLYLAAAPDASDALAVKEKLYEIGYYQEQLDEANALIYEGYRDYDSGSYAAAEQAFEAAIRVDPGLTTAHLGLANALKLQERWAEAIAKYDEALAMGYDESDAYQVHWSIGYCYRQLDDFEKANESYRTALSVGGFG